MNAPCCEPVTICIAMCLIAKCEPLQLSHALTLNNAISHDENACGFLDGPLTVRVKIMCASSSPQAPGPAPRHALAAACPTATTCLPDAPGPGSASCVRARAALTLLCALAADASSFCSTPDPSLQRACPMVLFMARCIPLCGPLLKAPPSRPAEAINMPRTTLAVEGNMASKGASGSSDVLKQMNAIGDKLMAKVQRVSDVSLDGENTVQSAVFSVLGFQTLTPAEYEDGHAKCEVEYKRQAKRRRQAEKARANEPPLPLPPLHCCPSLPILLRLADSVRCGKRRSSFRCERCERCK